MEFLVRIAIALPADLDEEVRTRLLAAELARGRELRSAGHIARIWRVPGGLRNVAVWEARDATELHELIASLPLYRWMTADVTPLALHPVEAPQDAASAGP